MDLKFFFFFLEFLVFLSFSCHYGFQSDGLGPSLIDFERAYSS